MRLTKKTRNDYARYPPLIKTRKVLFVDVMKDERFLFTMPYRYCPAFKLDLKDIYEKVIEKRPSLKDKKFEIYID